MRYTCLAQDCVTRVMLSRSIEGVGGGGGGLHSHCRPELYNIVRVCWTTKQKVEIKKCKFVRLLKGAIPTILMGAILIQ